MSSIINDFFKILETSVKTVTPEFIFRNKIKISSSKIQFESFELNLDQFEKIYVIGFGKASSAMATELEKYLFERIEDGIVITKYGFKTQTKKIRVFEAGHPIPDENTIKFSWEIIKLLEKRTSNDLIICLISGGGSTLFEIIAPGFDLKSLQSLNECLLKKQFSIYEINHFRKLLSNVKNGKLLRYISPSTCLSLILSDVIGNDLSIIASGPTYINDMHTYFEIKSIEDFQKVLKDVISFSEINKIILKKEFSEDIIDYYNNKVFNLIIASNEDLVHSTKNIIKNLGYDVYKIKYNISASTEQACENILDELNTLKKEKGKFKKAFIFGGETFLEVTGTGKGGRNSHLILQILNKILSQNLQFDFQYVIASFASDGNDGPTDSAGAFITHEAVSKIKISNKSPFQYLKSFDSYNFFNEFRYLIKTGVTYTNVADLIFGLFER